MIKSISSNNLPEAVDYLNLRIIKYHQSQRAYKIAVSIWAAIYFFFFCVFTYGAAELFVLKGHAEIELPILSGVWHSFYNLLLPIVDTGVWYLFAAMVVSHVCVLPLIVGVTVRLTVLSAYTPDVSEHTVNINDQHLPEKLFKKSWAFEYAKYTVNTKKLCLPFSIAYVLLMIASCLFMDPDALKLEAAASPLILALKISAALVILAVAFFAFWGLMALSYLICRSLTSIKRDAEFTSACAAYRIELETAERMRHASSGFDIGKYYDRRGIGKVHPTRQGATVQSSISNQSSFDNSVTTSTPYVSLEEKIAAENAYYSGKLSVEEYNRITSSYWEHHENDEYWPDVGDG